MEQAFQEYLDEEFPVGAKRTRSAIIRRNYADRIVQFLKDTSGESDKIFRHLVKRNGFQLMDLPEAGLREQETEDQQTVTNTPAKTITRESPSSVRVKRLSVRDRAGLAGSTAEQSYNRSP